MPRMRRGHRLHSISGCEEQETTSFLREGTSVSGGSDSSLRSEECEFLELIKNGDTQGIRTVAQDPDKTSNLCQSWFFVRKCAKEIIVTRNIELIKAVMEVLTMANSKAFAVGKLFLYETLDTATSALVLGILNCWVAIHGGPPSSLEIIQSAVYFASHKRLKETNTQALVELAIYCATVDRQTEILESLLKWHEEQVEVVGQSTKLNADCMIHAALEDDREQLSVLYHHGYRLGNETDRRITKDYLKRIKLFRARASPAYKSVVFESSLDIYNDDPLKKCFEYAMQARIYADKIQDFTKEYVEIAENCEEFARGLLDRCTTKHEVQMLLQTRSYRGHMDANFNVAILDGHKNFVAHEKFQQLLHKKWGQQDRLQMQQQGDSGVHGSYNIFWTEKSSAEKLLHIIKQVFVFFLLPFVYVLSTLQDKISLAPLDWLLLQGQIPVNRFLYWEMSKFLFYFVVLLTLVDEHVIYDILATLWIISYLLENFRTIHRLYRFGGGGSCDYKRIFKRWLTFKNIYILATDLIFLAALVLRCVAYLSSQSRIERPYEGNEIAFVAAAVWSMAALLTFLRSIQGGLMWRQTGPVIISMSYMILDILVFLFLFVIVYLSFTVCMVYIYSVYSLDRTQYFGTHKSAFKLFFWALIRTDIYVGGNGTAAVMMYNSSCLWGLVNREDGEITTQEMEFCSNGAVIRSEEIEEGISYVAGNTLWAFYQFTVFVVLLSILRARMVNTYHRVFKEADVQWKYFRASIWWKYLDEDSVLPPPFTGLYFIHMGIKYLFSCIKNCCCGKSPDGLESNESKRKNELQDQIKGDKQEFERRYQKLMLMLISQPVIHKS